MSEIIDLRDIKLSRMSPDELIVESIESTAVNFIQVNKTLKSLIERLCMLEQTVSSLSETFASHEEEFEGEH
jgi:hypothetical protein